MGLAPLEELRALVVDDPALRDKLVGLSDEEAFVSEVVTIAHQRGIDLSPADVVAGLAEGRRRRRQQWV